MTLRMKSGIGCAAVLLVACFTMGDQIASTDPLSHCQQRTQLIAELPISHARNRCAYQPADATSPKISWGSWFTGQSIQFHYLDLLELLSRRELAQEHRP